MSEGECYIPPCCRALRAKRRRGVAVQRELGSEANPAKLHLEPPVHSQPVQGEPALDCVASRSGGR